MSGTADRFDLVGDSANDNLGGLSGAPPLQTGDGGGNSGGMETRVTRMEEWAKQADARMGRVEDKLDKIIQAIADVRGGLPTKTDMRNYLLTGIGIFVGIIALVFTGLGVMQALTPAPATQPPAPPVVIQVPAYQAPPPTK
jgi:hypothetical protein